MRLGLLTVAIGPLYDQFVAPWLAAALITYPESTAEVAVLDPANWSNRHARQVAALRSAFGDRFLLRPPGLRWRKLGLKPGTLRFCLRPSHGAPELLHIGDVDLVLSDPAMPDWHVAAMERLGLPYSNRIRDRERRLTGLHVVRVADYFAPLSPTAVANAIRQWGRGNDEHFLYRLCERHHGLPGLDVGRPDFGVHCSPNRPAARDKGCHWGIDNYATSHLALVQSPVWSELEGTFDPRFRQRLSTIRRHIERGDTGERT